MAIYDVILVGSGPAALAARRALNTYKRSTLTIEAGKDSSDRIDDKTILSTLNGFGGGALWSDRKIVALAGLCSFMTRNPHMMRDSFISSLEMIKATLPQHSASIDDLIKVVREIAPMDASLARIRTIVESFREFRQVKLPNSLVLSDFDEALAIIEAYRTSSDQPILFERRVVAVKQADDHMEVTLDNGTTVMGKRVLLALGRMAAFQLPSIAPFVKLVPNRFEVGVRVDVDSYPGLKEALTNMTAQSTSDPKIICKATYTIDGMEVECEFRTFCVCVPESGSGYVVETKDLVTGVGAYSGSSSYDELRLRKDRPHVNAGSNLGIMMRIKDTDFIGGKSLNVGSCAKFTTSTDSLDMINTLSEFYPDWVCGPLASGIVKLLGIITKKPVNNHLTLYGPCIEGTIYYPDISPGTGQSRDCSRLFFAGDGGNGDTRGLLQALADGDCTGKAIAMDHDQEVAIAEKQITEHQSLVVPTFEYGKVIVSTPGTEGITQRHAEEVMDGISLDRVAARAKEILKTMARVSYCGKLSEMGGVFELHHFFLSQSQQEGHLDRVDERSVRDYLTACNYVEENKIKFMNLVAAALVEHYGKDDSCWKMCAIECVLHLTDTFEAHVYKACLLSLRGRKLDNRDNHTDVPVMQPAFKIVPLTMDLGETIKKNHAKWIEERQCMKEVDEWLEEYQHVAAAIVASILDLYFEGLDWGCKLVRTKIETQQVKVQARSGTPYTGYCECHVKINISPLIRGDPPLSFTKKQEIMWLLSGLIEGRDAVFRQLSKTLALSINLFKHPTKGQQFFLTFRTDTIEEMDYMRRVFSKIIETAIQCSDVDSPIRQCLITMVPDAENVIYDNNKELDTDIGWYPTKSNYLMPNYKEAISKFINPDIPKLFFATGNPDKVQEVNAALPNHCVLQSRPPCPDDYHGFDLEASARRKAEIAYNRLNRPVLVESTGLVLVKDYPGALTKEVMGQYDSNRDFVDSLSNKDANMVTHFVYTDGVSTYRTTSSVKGELSSSSASSTGFGFDDVLIVEALGSSEEWKSTHSSRVIALKTMAKWL